MAQPRKNRKESAVATRRKRATTLNTMGSSGKNRHTWLNVGIFFLFALVFILVGFFGLSPASPVLQRDQIARVRVVAEVPFTYESTIATEQRREALRGFHRFTVWMVPALKISALICVP